MSDTLYYFVHLRDGTTRRFCWVDRNVSIGNRLTLKNSDEPERWWEVIFVSEDVRHKSMLPGGAWNVGGL